MKLTSQPITVIVTDDGKQVLKLGGLADSDSYSLTVSVHEQEELGLWLEIDRADQQHFFLLRWEYILAIDVPSGTQPDFGLKGRGPIRLVPRS